MWVFSDREQRAKCCSVFCTRKKKIKDFWQCVKGKHTRHEPKVAFFPDWELWVTVRCFLVIGDCSTDDLYQCRGKRHVRAGAWKCGCFFWLLTRICWLGCGVLELKREWFKCFWQCTDGKRIGKGAWKLCFFRIVSVSVDCGVFRPENRVWFLTVCREKNPLGKSLVFKFCPNWEVARFFTRDLIQQIRVCAGMYIGIIWRFGNCRLRHCLDLSQQCQGRVFS